MAREGKVIIKILKDICQELPFFGHSHQRSKVTIVKPCDNNLKKLECNLTFQQNAITQDNRANFVFNADGTKGVESGTPIKYIVKRFDDDVLAKEEVVLQDNFGWAFQEVLWQDKIPRGKRVKYVFRLEVGKEFCEKELEYNKPATAICGENSLTKEEETNEYIKFRYKTYVNNFEDNLVRHLYKSIDGVNWSECPFTEENVHITDGSHIELLYTVQKSSLQGETRFKASVDVMTKGQLELTCETGVNNIGSQIPDFKCSLNIEATKEAMNPTEPKAIALVKMQTNSIDSYPANSVKYYLETLVDGVSIGKNLVYEHVTNGLLPEISKEIDLGSLYFKKAEFIYTVQITNGTECSERYTLLNLLCQESTIVKENNTIKVKLPSNLDGVEGIVKEVILYYSEDKDSWISTEINPTINGDEYVFSNIDDSKKYFKAESHYRLENYGYKNVVECQTDIYENIKETVSGEITLSLLWKEDDPTKEISVKNQYAKIQLLGFNNDRNKNFIEVFGKFTQMVIKRAPSDNDSNISVVRYFTEQELEQFNNLFKGTAGYVLSNLSTWTGIEEIMDDIDLNITPESKAYKYFIDYTWEYTNPYSGFVTSNTNKIVKLEIDCGQLYLDLRSKTQSVATFRLSATYDNFGYPIKATPYILTDKNIALKPDVYEYYYPSNPFRESLIDVYQENVNSVNGFVSGVMRFYITDPETHRDIEVKECITSPVPLEFEPPTAYTDCHFDYLSLCSQPNEYGCDSNEYSISNPTKNISVIINMIGSQCDLTKGSIKMFSGKILLGDKVIHELTNEELRAMEQNAKKPGIMVSIYTLNVTNELDNATVGQEIKFEYELEYNNQGLRKGITSSNISIVN